MDDDEPETINAEFTHVKPEDKKKTGLFGKIGAYIEKNQENNRKRGVKPLSDEFSGVGSNYFKDLAKGASSVGQDLEDELMGRKKKQPQSTPQSQRVVSTRGFDPEEEQYFTDKLCDFLRYVQEDDDVMLFQHKKDYQKVDYIYLGKLLTRYYGHKVVLKQRDLMTE